jgi:hypothetical protein
MSLMLDSLRDVDAYLMYYKLSTPQAKEHVRCWNYPRPTG